MGLLNLQGVKKVERVPQPVFHIIADAVGPPGEAKTHDIRRNYPEVVRQGGDYQAPVRPGADAGAGSVQQKRRRPMSLVMVVGCYAAGIDG